MREVLHAVLSAGQWHRHMSVGPMKSLSVIHSVRHIVSYKLAKRRYKASDTPAQRSSQLHQERCAGRVTVTRYAL